MSRNIVYRSGRNVIVTFGEAFEALKSGDQSIEVCYLDPTTQQVPFGMDVDIYRPDKAGFSPEGEPEWFTKGCEVNWGALGSGEPERARVYAELMEEAANLAELVNSAIKVVTRDEAWAAYKARDEAVTATHFGHTEFVEHCSECWKIRNAEKKAATEAAEALAAGFQKRANKLTKKGQDRYELAPKPEKGAEWDEAVRDAHFKFVNAVYAVTECAKSPRGRRGASMKHLMNAEGECQYCGRHIDGLESDFAALVASVRKVA